MLTRRQFLIGAAGMAVGVVGARLMPSVTGLNFGPASSAPSATWLELLGVGSAGWMTNIQTPRAASYNGWTYVAWSQDDGDVQVVAINESTATAGTPITLKTFATGDTHNTPALLVRDSDHKLLVVYSGHDSSNIYKRISTTSLDTDPDLGDGFAAETSLHSQLGSFASYTYPILVQLTSETNDPIYLFWRQRQTTDRLRYSKSTDGGTTWAAGTLLSKATNSGASKTYWNIATNGTDRFDVFWCDYSDGTSSQMHHFYFTAANFRQSNATLIISEADLIASAGASAFTKNDMTLVLANTNGPVERAMGASWDGAPAAAAWQRHTTGTDNRVVSVRWRAGAWQTNTVVESAGGLLDGFLYLTGAAMHPTDPDIVYVPVKVGSIFEMSRYTSADDGVTWVGEQITELSTSQNMTPVVVTNASADIEAVWHYGTLTSDTDYSVGLRGATA